MAFEKIGTKSDIPAGTVRVFEVNGRSLCVANLDGAEFYAIDNLCTHDNGPLGEGTLADGLVECPRHGARFDVRSGKVLSFPAIVDIPAYPVRVEDGEVLIGLPPAEA